MRLRITIAFVAVLAVALALAGTVGFFLVRHASAESARATVLRQTRVLADEAKQAASESQLPKELPLILRIAGINQPAVIISVTANGKLLGSPPPGIAASAINGKALASGKAISLVDNRIAFAAAPIVYTAGLSVTAIGLEAPVSFSDDSIWYFLLAGGISLLMCVVLTGIITRRISQHVVAASKAAGLIASGDLSARVAISGLAYPELVQLGSSLNEMAESLERSQRLERQFLLSVSHDLRTPLTSIRGYAEAISEGIPTDLPHAASVLVSESHRLERLIADLLDLARIDAHRFSLELSEIDAAATTRRATDALRYAFVDAAISLEVELPDAPLIVVGDADRLSQVVANLLENALKFATSAVSVKVIREEGMAVISVSDDGPGIAPSDMPHVFERLFSTRPETARAAGTGLGLAIVAELIGAMSGSVDVKSPLTQTGGTLMSVRVPLSHSSDSEGP
jgi:signal transduction histidine kinase